jgi:hypothetical protein
MYVIKDGSPHGLQTRDDAISLEIGYPISKPASVMLATVFWMREIARPTSDEPAPTHTASMEHAPMTNTASFAVSFDLPWVLICIFTATMTFFIIDVRDWRLERWFNTMYWLHCPRYDFHEIYHFHT